MKSVAFDTFSYKKAERKKQDVDPVYHGRNKYDIYF